MALSKFGGFFDALQYYYGGGVGLPPALIVLTAPSATGAGSVTLDSAVAVLADGGEFFPLATTADVLIGDGDNQETVTPSAVTNPTSPVPGSGGFTGTFTNLHGVGDQVKSATCGLQEAVNDAIRLGGGTVLVSSAWAAAGGTQGMYEGVTFDSPATVTLIDNRTGS